jgi:ABC-type dipeptide/oligopeptide/nickel transport system ATPase subunit
MLISIEENPLSDSLVKYDNQVVKNDDPLPKSFGVVFCIVGKKGSGKTTLFINLLRNKNSPYNNHFDNIYLISPTAKKDEKMAFLVNELEEEGKFYEELNEDTIEEIINKVESFNEEYIKAQEESSDEEIIDDPVFGKEIKKKKKKKKKTKKIIRQPTNLLVIDDCIHLLPKSGQKSKINEIFTTSRHKKLSIILLCQKYNKINPLIRNQIDIISIFPTDNAREIETIQDDFTISKELFDLVYKEATNEPNSFLHISFFGNKPNFYKRFSKMILN